MKNLIFIIILTILNFNVFIAIGSECGQREAQFIGQIKSKIIEADVCRIFLKLPIIQFNEHIFCPIFLEEISEEGFLSSAKTCDQEIGSEISGVLIKNQLNKYIFLEE